jgi:hypothetical protein
VAVACVGLLIELAIEMPFNYLSRHLEVVELRVGLLISEKILLPIFGGEPLALIVMLITLFLENLLDTCLKSLVLEIDVFNAVAL